MGVVVSIEGNAQSKRGNIESAFDKLLNAVTDLEQLKRNLVSKPIPEEVSEKDLVVPAPATLEDFLINLPIRLNDIASRVRTVISDLEKGLLQ